MRFVEAEFDGMILKVPVIGNTPWSDWADDSLHSYPTFCGAGKGLGDKIVPDTIYGLPISPACHIHDVSWEIAPPTPAARNLSDEMFLHNMMVIIRAESNWFMRYFRNQRAMTYYNAVNSEQNRIFWKTKAQQQST